MRVKKAIYGITAGVAAIALSAEKPNVVIIYGDDVGYGDVGVYGSKMIPTPNIDRLAANGLRFTDAHSAAATCTPSRFSILTGNCAFRHDGTSILPANAKMAIPEDMFTLPDLFKQAGYATAAIGKWHLGLGDGVTPIDWNGEIGPGPLDIGFDYCFLLPATNDRVPCVYVRNRRIVGLDPDDPITVDYKNKLTDTYPDGVEHPEAMTFYKSTHGHNNSVINGIGRIGWMSGGKAALWNDETIADELVREAKTFIKTNCDKPFFLYFASQDIHVPRVPHPRFRGKSELGYRGDAMVQFDWSVGEILKMLNELGLTEKTLVVFSSDNGPVYDDGYADGTTVKTSKQEVDRGHDASGIFRGGKYQIYEGGTRVPLIISWPGQISPGVSDAVVSQIDFMASFAGLLGMDLPADSATDSRNILPVLLGENSNLTDGPVLEHAARRLALRQGRFKYIPPVNGRGAELYNLDNDPGETANLAKMMPERCEELDARMDQLLTSGIRSVFSSSFEESAQ
jgi:arylsulfatase A-like enzyme